jgi:hypothetical protein
MTEKLDLQLRGVEKDIEILQRKLGNPQFIARSPAAVVEKEAARLYDLRETQRQLQRQLLELDVWVKPHPEGSEDTGLRFTIVPDDLGPIYDKDPM